MLYSEFVNKMELAVFSVRDVAALFPDVEYIYLKQQLHRYYQSGNLIKVKKDKYYLHSRNLDTNLVGGLCHAANSYISLESALSYYGVNGLENKVVMHVSDKRINKFTYNGLDFRYQHINPQLYFGYNKMKIPNSTSYYHMATYEKAIIDYAYFRGPDALYNLRYSKNRLYYKRFENYLKSYPAYLMSYPFF